MTMSVMSSHVEPCCTCYFYQRAQSLKGERGVAGHSDTDTARQRDSPAGLRRERNDTTVDRGVYFSNLSSRSCFQIRVISIVSLF